MNKATAPSAKKEQPEPTTPSGPATKDAPATPEGTAIQPPEHGGPKGLEPTRYGDWEQNGRCTDF